MSAVRRNLSESQIATAFLECLRAHNWKIIEPDVFKAYATSPSNQQIIIEVIGDKLYITDLEIDMMHPDSLDEIAQIIFLLTGETIVFE